MDLFPYQESPQKFKPAIMILTEDEKSSNFYFNAIQDDYPNLIIKSEFIGHTKSHLITNHAIEKAKENKQAMFFVVYDVHNNDEIKNDQKSQNLIKNANLANLALIISKPCYELWVLLHFSDDLSNITNEKSVIAEIKSKTILKRYSKKHDNVYKKIKEHTKIALNNAKKIAEHPIKTDIHQIFEHIDSDA